MADNDKNTFKAFGIAMLLSAVLWVLIIAAITGAVSLINGFLQWVTG